MEHIKIHGREFALAFNVNVMETLENTIDDFDVGKITEYVKKPGGLKDVLVAMTKEGEDMLINTVDRLLGRKEGEDMEGRKLDVDRDWFGRYMGASGPALAKIQIAIFNTLRKAMFMETESEEEDGEVDVVLEEIKKKEERDG